MAERFERRGLALQVIAGRQRQAAAEVVSAITATADQARLVASATDEQAKGVTSLVQANNHIRKTAQEVKKAMAEQTRAARDALGSLSQRRLSFSACLHFSSHIDRESKMPL